MEGPLKTRPRISIVVPSFNQGRFLRQALDSILTQSYLEREIVVMDGGSTDQSLEIIKEYAGSLTYWRSQRDAGQAAAINEGLRHCSGDIVAWLKNLRNKGINQPVSVGGRVWKSGVIDQHFRARPMKCPRHLGPNAPRGTGDERSLPFERKRFESHAASLARAPGARVARPR